MQNLLFVLCFLKCITCETNLLSEIVNEKISSGTITVINNRDHRRWTVFRNKTNKDPKLDELNSKQKWLLETYDSETKRLAPTQQRKQHPHKAIIIFLNDITAIYHIIDFIRSKRIVGPETKMIITAHGIGESKIKKLLTLVRDRLKILEPILLSDNKNLSIGKTDSRKLSMRALWYEDGIYVFYENFKFNGVCIQIAETIASSLNLSLKIDFLMTAENSYRPFNRDGEFGGFLGVLHRQETDLVCGSISLFETRHHVSDALPSFTQESLIWVVATNGAIRGWKRLIFEFSHTVWAFVALIWVVSLGVLYGHFRLRGSKADFSKIAVHIVGATLEISFIKHLGGFRGFLSLFLVYSMIITSAYKSGLTSLLTLPIMEEKISTVEEGLAENRVVFVLPSWEDIIESWTDFDDATTLWDVDFRGRYEIMSSALESLQRMANNQSVMTLMPEDEAESLILKYFLNIDGLKAFYYLQERFMNYPKVICMSPGHPLFDKFAAKQHQIIEAGLIDLWFEHLFHNQLVRAIFHSRNVIFEGTEPVPLAISHLSGLMFGFLFGLFVSLVVFVCEKFVSWWKK